MEIMPLSNCPAIKSYVELDLKTVKKQREDVNLVRIGMFDQSYVF